MGRVNFEKKVALPAKFARFRKKVVENHLENIFYHLTPNATRLEFYRRFVKGQDFFML